MGSVAERVVSRAHGFVALLIFALPGRADEASVAPTVGFVPLTPDKPYVHVIHQGRTVKIQRAQNPEYRLEGYFAKSVRKCPPFCLQSSTPDPRVAAVGEVELFDFIENRPSRARSIIRQDCSWTKPIHRAWTACWNHLARDDVIRSAGGRASRKTGGWSTHR